MLDSLSAMQLQLGVLSNKPNKFTIDTVNFFFPETEFACVFGKRPGIPLKPDPTGLLEMAANRPKYFYPHQYHE